MVKEKIRYVTDSHTSDVGDESIPDAIARRGKDGKRRHVAD
jgi:hypothetical protein